MLANLIKNPLIVLYGPPGVGKLMVAKELQKVTNLPLFHNHLTSDLATLVFGEKKPPELVDKMRLDFFEAAAKDNLGLIFTFVYAHGQDDYFMDNLLEIAQRFETEIYFVQLLCQENIWKERLENEERSQYRKVRDFSLVQETCKKVDLFSPYSKAKKSKTLDISKLSPDQTAQKIQEFINF